MAGIVKIDDEEFSTDDFIKFLKLNGRFETLMEEILKDQITVHAAKKHGITISESELQERADAFRRVHGLHRAKDTNEYLDALGIDLDDLERFLSETLYQEKMYEQVCNDKAIEEYFSLNSPRFDSMEISHIMMDSEGGAKEMFSVLEDDPDSFDEMAREHSSADTSDDGGHIGQVLRGSLQPTIEAKVFNAAAGEMLGPFASADGEHFEIFRIDAKNAAELNDDTRDDIKRLLKDEWIAGRAREHRVEVL